MKLKVIRKVLIVLVALIILATNSMLSTANAVSIFLDDSSKDESSLVVGAGISSLNKVQRASYPPYVHNVDTGSVFKIYHHDGTSADYSNAGWCMDKGANLYGYGYSGGWATVSGEYDAYNTNNAREGSSGSIRWLLDNILRVGNGVSDDEKGFYRNNLQRIVGSNANIADYSEDRIFEIEQYVLWSFTNNVTGDSAISYPTSDPLFVALKNAAASHSDYSSDGSVNVNIDTSKANVNSNGIVGPFVVSNNKLMVLSAKLNNADTTIYTDEACTKTLSRYNEYNGNIYIKAGSTSNVNISFNYGGFDTTAYYYTTTGNPGNYRDQSFIMISREKKSQDVSFGNKNVNLEVHKKDMDGNDIGNIGTFKYWTTDDFGSGLVPTGNGTVMENHKSSITMAHGQTKYIWITETEAPKPYGLGYFEAPSGQTNFICIKVSVDASGNVTQSYPKEPQDGYNGYLKYIKDNDTTIYLQKDSEYFMGVSTSGDNIIVSVKDPVQSGNFRFQLIKEDNEGTKLANAEFEISITDEKGKVIYKTAEGKTEKTNVNGLINLYGLEIEDEGKTYTVKVHETKAPDGYIPGNDVTFTVESESNSSGYVLKPVAEKEISGAMVTITNSLVKVLVKNTEKVGSFNFQLIKEDNEGTKLEGAEFEISIVDEEGNVIYKTAEGKVEKTDSNGLINLQNLNIESAGKTYTVTIHETKAPNGYIAGKDVSFTVESEENDGKTGYVLKPVAEKEISGSMVTITNSLIKVLVKNTEKVGRFSFQLIKEDNEGTKLAGAEFEISIVDKEGNVIYKTAEGKVEKTDSKGLINLQNLNIESAGKIYTVTIHETKAPNGYIAGKDVSFTVESKDNDEKTGYELKPVSQKEVSGAMVTVTNSLITVLVKNTQKVGSYTVNLVKVDKKGNIISKEVSKFTVNGQEIETENGYLNIVNSKEISKNGQTDVYKVTETEAPKGYEKYSGEIALTVVGKETSKGYEVDTQNSKLLAGLEEVKPGKESTDGYVTWSITSNTITIKLQNRQFDLALRKFITGVTSVDGSRTDITTRVPVFKVDKDGKYVYEHTKEPVLVANQNVVEYTIRVYNEGEIAGYAKEIKDDIPEGLEFLPDDEINKEYRWIMLDEEGNETDKVSEAKYIVTDYLSKENEKTAGENLLKAFNEEDYEAGAIKEPDYKEVKVAFKVTMPNTSDEIIINQAQISDDSDEDGNEVTDKDSTPNEWIDGEDDQDIEKIKVQYFDLALRKWVTKAIVIEDGKEVVRETGHKAEDDPEAVVKVDLKKSKLNKVVVKFEYQIRVTNEGQIAGSVEEISDYIPEGLKFVAADNPEWEEVDGKVVTDQLAGQIMQPGESKEVTILLTWINREDNMGLKVNVAEISKDYNEYGSPDIDSTPNNKVPGEDDIDDAPVMLTVTTGQEVVYLGITIAVLGIIAGGVIGIKKFVIK